jgi:hypothetical protein
VSLKRLLWFTLGVLTLVPAETYVNGTLVSHYAEYVWES